MIIESIAVIGAEIIERRKESLKALKPLYRVNTSLNHLVVRGKNLYPQVGKSAPIGTQIYIKITKRAAAAQKMVRGILTLLSSISILARVRSEEHTSELQSPDHLV